ncbi:MAG: hypothetical protein K0B05_07905 [Bacteroidales bacterium]|nr:hypothetical protein [Bacteroidales bacterium]
MRNYTCLILLLLLSGCSQQKPGDLYLRIPVIDVGNEIHRQVVVDREEGQYLGHPTTVLLEDGKTILTVYPKGHGRGEIVYKKSNDGGLTGSDPKPLPNELNGDRHVLKYTPDGTFDVTTYGHWERDKQPYILSVRFKIEELDSKFKAVK